MTKQIFLHIGIEKTGSTTLQAVGAMNREALARRGILYPKSPGPKNHTGLAVYASSGGTLKDIRQISGLASQEAFADFQARFPTELRQEIADSGCDRVWLSNEHLSSRVRKPAEIMRLVELLRPLAEEVRVVIYIRNQPDLVVSSYSTAIRSGSIRDLFLPRSEKDYFFNFALMLKRWSTLWDKRALDIRIFDRSLLRDGDITADFFAAMGEELDRSIKVPAGLNTSLDAHAIQFLRLFNSHVQRFTDSGLNPDYGQIGSVLEAVSRGPKFTPPPAFMRQVAGMFEDSNAHVAAHYFGRPGSPLFDARPFPNVDAAQELTVGDARTLGIAALDSIDTQIEGAQARLLNTARQSLDAAPPPGTDAVMTGQTIEDVVAATATLWQARQQRLQQLRGLTRKAMQAGAGAAGPSDTAAG